MPEIKHTFLAGKMNKSLDDRLIPEGEYRDARNIEISTDVYGGGDIGTIRRINGNEVLENQPLSFLPGTDVIGCFFDDKNNTIYYFVTNGESHSIFRYKNGQIQSLATGDFLNFNKDYRITGVNLLEDVLFWTDDLNPPRRINVEKGTNYYTTAEQISVATIAPFKSPTISMYRDTNIDSNYMEDKFVRFSYRYRFEENEYSVYAPFTQPAFQLHTDETSTPNNTVTATQEQETYETSELRAAVNGCNKVSIKIPLPNFELLDGLDENVLKTLYLIRNTNKLDSVDILIKESNLSSVRIIDTIKLSEMSPYDMDIVSNGTDPQELYYIYTYNSTIPKTTIAEDQLVRVYDNVPLTAKSQEVAGNRVIYGNFQQEIPVPQKIDFSVGYQTEDIPTTNPEQYYQHLSLKQDRTYTVGIILSDRYGRTSPVILPSDGDGSFKVPYDISSGFISADKRKSINVTFNSNCFDDIDSRWVSYSVVVKQTQQEYYNVYTPGILGYDGSSFTTILSDNVNKVPRNPDTVNNENEISSSDQRFYVRLENQSYFQTAVENRSGLIRQSQIYTVTTGTSSWDFRVTLPTDYEEYTATGTDGQTFAVNNVDPLGGNVGNEVTAVTVYADGLLCSPTTHYDILYTSGVITSIRFKNEFTQPYGRNIRIYKTVRYYVLSAGSSSTFTNIKSFSNPFGFDISYTQTATETNIIYTYTGDGFSPLYDPIITSVVQQNVSSKLLKVTGIGSVDTFSDLPDYAVNASNQEFGTGFYKVDNKYLIANFKSSYGVELTGTDLYASGKVNQLSILETEPFESALDIYYETSTNGLISNITYDTPINVSYYNCFIVKNTDTNWYIEESRIKGGFNETSMDYGVQAFTTDVDWPSSSSRRRINTLIYSGIYNPKTNTNNSNQFPSGQNITKSLDIQYGSIQKLFSEDNDIIVFQEEKISQIPIDRDIIYTAEGSPQVTTSNVVLGDVIPYAGNFGIGKNPESFAHYAGRKYFVDEPKGAVLRLSRDGITEISNYGMRTHILQNMTGSSVIYGMWDMKKRQYVLSYINSSLTNGYETLSFDESSNGWVSFYDYQPQFGGSLDGDFYTFKNALIYKHYVNGIDTFYTDPSDFVASVTTVINQNPSASKNFLTINYEGSNSWNISSIQTDIDTGLPVSAPVDNTNDTDTIINLSQFRSFDGKYFANIINNSSSNPDEISFGRSISGIKGHYMNVKIQTNITGSELFSVSTNYNINSY